MLVKKGDKIRLIKPMGVFDNVGEICDVINVDDNGTIFFNFGEGVHLGVMSNDECEKYFEMYEEPEFTIEYIIPTVTQEHIDSILAESDVSVTTAFDKCTVVTVRLPNGFVITESSACVDPRNYDKEMGIEICMDRITNKLWELEGYKLQCELYEESIECPHIYDDVDCCECECAEECDCECDCEPEEYEECFYDCDCDNCDCECDIEETKEEDKPLVGQINIAEIFDEIFSRN